MTEKIFSIRIKQKYDLEQNWLNSDIVLLQGETAYVVDSLTKPTWVKTKVGDGESLFKDLPYQGSLTSQENTDFITQVIEDYNRKTNFLLMCGGAADEFEVPPFLTDEVLEEAVNNSLDDLLTRKF